MSSNVRASQSKYNLNHICNENHIPIKINYNLLDRSSSTNDIYVSFRKNNSDNLGLDNRFKMQQTFLETNNTNFSPLEYQKMIDKETICDTNLSTSCKDYKLPKYLEKNSKSLGQNDFSYIKKKQAEISIKGFNNRLEVNECSQYSEELSSSVITTSKLSLTERSEYERFENIEIHQRNNNCLELKNKIEYDSNCTFNTDVTEDDNFINSPKKYDFMRFLRKRYVHFDEPIKSNFRCFINC